MAQLNVQYQNKLPTIFPPMLQISITQTSQKLSKKSTEHIFFNYLCITHTREMANYSTRFEC